MKKFKSLLFAALALSAAVAVSCNKEKIAPEPQPEPGKISVSVRGMLGEYSQNEDTKAALVNNLRVKWAAEDKVYAFDGAKCLGELTVSLKDDRDYYALLTGELGKPQSGTSKITLVYATGLSKEQGDEVENIEIDLANQTASDSPESAPFVAYGSLDYESGVPMIENQIVDFSLATSIMRFNCSGLEPEVAITGAKLKGMSNKSTLEITKDGPSVGESEAGDIELACGSFSASDKGAKVLYVSIAPKTTAPYNNQVLEVTQTKEEETKTYNYVLGEKSRSAAKSYNVICPMTLGVKTGSIAEANQALQEGKTSIQITNPDDADTPIIFPESSPAGPGVDGKTVSIKATGLPADVTLTFQNGANAQGPASLLIDSDAKKLVIDTPNTHVDIVGGTYDSVVATTSATTLVVEKDVKITDLTLKKGGADIYGNVTKVSEVQGGASLRYFISTADQLCAIANETDVDTFKGTEVHLVADIDLSSKQFTPIVMKAEGRFTLFDGGNHTVSNMGIVDCGRDYAALIRFMAGGVVKNVSVKDAVISYNADAKDNARGAAIVGIEYGGTIENCHAENVSITGYQKMGGIVGYLAQSGDGVVVRNCSARNITFTNNTKDLTYQAGGIIGYTLNYDGDILVEGCSVSDIIINNLYDGSKGENAPYYCGTFIGSLDNQAAKEGLKIELKNNTISGTNTPQISHIYADAYFGWANNNERTSSGKQPYLATILIDGQEWTPDYPFVILPTGKKYSTLDKALAAASENQTVQIKAAGDYTVETLSTKASVVEATVDGVVFNHTATKDWVANCENTTVRNITWKAGTGSYHYFKGIHAKNCIFDGMITTHTAGSFEDCIFMNSDGYQYCAHGYSGDFTWTKCTFNCSGKAFYAHNEGSEMCQFVFDTCTFNATGVTEKCKAAIFVKHNWPNQKYTVRINNCTANYDAYLPDDPDLTSTPLWNIEEGTSTGANVKVYVNDTLKYDNGFLAIANATALKNFADAVNAGKSYSGQTVTLDADIDMKDIAWVPVGKTGQGQFSGTFNGQNHTISNLNINNADESADCATGLFGWPSGATIKNVKVNKATVSGHHNVGVIAGYLESSTIDNCHVTGATVSCTHVNDDADGDKCGGIVGFAGNPGTPVNGCTVSDTQISAGRDAGQVAGMAKTANITGCTANSVKVEANGSSSGENIRNEIIGRIAE